MSKNIKKIIHSSQKSTIHHILLRFVYKNDRICFGNCAMTIMVEGECKYVEDFKGGNMTWLVGIGEIDNISKMKKKAGIKK